MGRHLHQFSRFCTVVSNKHTHVCNICTLPADSRLCHSAQFAAAEYDDKIKQFSTHGKYTSEIYDYLLQDRVQVNTTNATWCMALLTDCIIYTECIDMAYCYGCRMQHGLSVLGTTVSPAKMA